MWVELKRALNRYWTWTTGGSNWRWAPTGVVAAFVFLMVIGVLFPPEEDTTSPKQEPLSVQAPQAALDVSSVVPTAIAPSPMPTSPQPTSTPVPTSIQDQIAKSYRDNRSFMTRASNEGLAVQWDDSTATASIRIQPKSIWNEGDSLSITAQSAVVASKAIWTTYPQVQILEVSLWGEFTDPYGKTTTEQSVKVTVTRTTSERFVYPGLKDNVILDNKAFFCLADSYRIHLAIYKEIKDKGCLERWGASKALPLPTVVPGSVASSNPASPLMERLRQDCPARFLDPCINLITTYAGSPFNPYGRVALCTNSSGQFATAHEKGSPPGQSLLPTHKPGDACPGERTMTIKAIYG